MEKQNKKRILYIDALKIFACMQVILLHSFCLEDMSWRNNDIIHIILSKLGVAIYAGVPIFFLVSGVTLLKKNRFDGIDNVYKQKIFPKIVSIIVIIAFSQFPYFLYLMFVKHKYSFTLLSFLNYIKMNVSFINIEGSMGFLTKYCFLLFFVPLLYYFVNYAKKNDILILVGCSFIVYFSILDENIANFFPVLFKNNAITFSHYVTMCLFGYCIHYYINNYKLAFFLITLLFIYFLYIKNDTFVGPRCEYLKAVFFMILFKCLFVKIHINANFEWITSLSKLTFGIYLIHMYVYNIYRVLFIKLLSIKELDNAYLCWSVAILTFATSAFIVHLLNKNKFINKLLNI